MSAALTAAIHRAEQRLAHHQDRLNRIEGEIARLRRKRQEAVDDAKHDLDLARSELKRVEEQRAARTAKRKTAKAVS
jgi:hypothetical protein